MTRKAFKYDVFVSYSSKDKEWVRKELLPAIEKAGYKACIDFRDFEPGAPSLNEMERAVIQSKKTVLVLSPAYVQSEWAEVENLMVQTLSPANRQRRLIPLLREKCSLPLRLGSLTYINFVDSEDMDIEWVKLYNALGKRNRVRSLATTEPKKSSPKVKKAVLLLRGEFSDFNSTRRDVLLSSLAAILQIKKDEIEFDRVYPGSIIVEITMPDNAASLLFELAQQNDKQLMDLEISQLKIDGLGFAELIPQAGQLPSGSHIPYIHNAVFTGRRADLLALEGNLLRGNKVTAATQSVVLVGMGGVGKTQIAAEFCYRYGRYFRGVHWINADHGIESEIAACGLSMGLPDHIQTIPEQARKTLQIWQEQPDRLIVLDSIEEPNILREWLPKLNGLQVLLTSHHQNWSADLGVVIYPINTFTVVDSLSLLRSLAPRLKNFHDNELIKITERLGNLPLAVDLAGRYLNARSTLTPANYLQRLDDAGSSLKHTSMSSWSKDESPTAHETSLLETFLVSWDQLSKSKTDEMSKDFFIASGYLAPNTPIPVEIFYGLANDDKEKADIALIRLQDIGLLNQTFVIHPLLAEFAHLQLTDDKERLVKILDSIDTACEKAYEAEIPSAFISLRPHLEKLAPTIEQYHIERAPRIWNALGYQYRMNAEYAKAKAANERAVEIGEELFGEDNSLIIPWLNNLGTTLADMGDLTSADNILERAIRIGMKNHSLSPLSAANMLNNLGAIAREMGNYTYAKELYENANEICEGKLEKNHPMFATIYNNLGILLKDSGDLASAKQMFERALKINEQVFGLDHPNIAIRLSNLALIASKLGEFDEARRLYERAIEIEEISYGKDHPNTATMINNYGLLLADMGDLNSARRLLERSIEIDEKAYGKNHPDIARDLSNLGGVLKSMNDLPGARVAYERALSILESNFGRNHPNIATILSNLAITLRNLGDLESAKRMYQNAIEIDENLLGKEHPDLATPLSNLAGVLMDLGDLNGARHMLERALELDRKFSSQDQLHVSATLNNLAILFTQMNDWGKAYEYMQQALEIKKRVLPSSHPAINRSIKDLETIKEKLSQQK